MNILRNIYSVFNFRPRSAACHFCTSKLIRYNRNYPVINNSTAAFRGSAVLKVANMSSVKKSAKNIVWVDLEMTGLDIEKDKILEIACLVTDLKLNIIAKGLDIVIHQPDEVLNSMGQWCIQQHGESGLTEASRQSKISLHEAETEVLKFISTYAPEKKCPLAGNSIYMDRLFILKYMPRIFNYLHYRIIDVSSLKEIAKRWYQSEYSRLPPKSFKHRAIDDLTESIKELEYYRENIFKDKNVNKEGD